MNITKFPIKPSHIKFLDDDRILYTCDMRSIGESMDYNIPAMWKYENLMPWILKDKFTAVNDTSQMRYANKNRFLHLAKGSDSKTSIYQKLSTLPLPDEVNGLWVGVPHPDADRMAREKKLKINYTYKDFLKRNDKLQQKMLLEKQTPLWNQVKNIKELNTILGKSPRGYLKRKHGSGGFTVFDTQAAGTNKKFKELYNENVSDWFFEEYVEGASCSIQCLRYKGKDEVTVFGYSEQILAEGKYFIGSKIKSLDDLNTQVFEQLSAAIQRLSPLLEGYEGFFGLDFIVTSDEKVFVLEANVRLTAVTIPTLLTNCVAGKKALYREDVKDKDKMTKEGVIVLAVDQSNNSVDTLEFFKQAGALGKTITFELTHCYKLEKSLENRDVHELLLFVDKNIGITTKVVFENFWPFGWTLCFILEESHCVISSWFLEQRILLDIFSCNTRIDIDRIVKEFALFFNAKGIIHLNVGDR